MQWMSHEFMHTFIWETHSQNILVVADFAGLYSKEENYIKIYFCTFKILPFIFGYNLSPYIILQATTFVLACSILLWQQEVMLGGP